MRRRVLWAVMAAAILGAVSAILSLSASAQMRTVLVRLKTGTVIRVTVNTAAGLPINQIPGLPGRAIQELTHPSSGGPGTTGSTPSPGGGGGGGSTHPGGSNGGGKGSKPSSRHGSGQGHAHSHSHANSQAQNKARRRAAAKRRARQQGAPGTPLRNKDGSPNPHNPTFFDALPGPAGGSAVPNFVIRQFQVPIFLLPIYQAAATQYGLRWEVLAAINEIESDYGRNLSVSTAGAVGWMQFLPSTWQTWGVDANNDGKKDPYNPVDAIFAAARYLKAAGGDKDIRKAIFAYNHAGWYVDSVMLRAKLITGVPGDLISSLTGLTEGRFPVSAHARYADDMVEQGLLKGKKLKAGQNAAHVVNGQANRDSIDIFSSDRAPVVATNDGQIKQIGNDPQHHGRFVVLQDVYGNQYTYNGLGSVARAYPVPKVDNSFKGVKAVTAHSGHDQKPKAAASAGRQLSGGQAPSHAAVPVKRAPATSASVAYKPRVFAHPSRANSRGAGGIDQMFTEQTTTKGYSTYSPFTQALGLNAHNSVLKPLRKGARVIAGTLLGQIGKTEPSKGPHVNFQIRPAGKGAPQIDPKPILDGWKLLESTQIYGPGGKNALTGSSFSIGQILLLPKPLLEKRVLADPRIDIYAGGRNDIKTHQIDRRVLATLEYLAESGLRPTVSCLKSGHSERTSSGNISEHSSGNAVDISAINGTPILGHQDKGGITEQTVRRLMLLQGSMRPHQIISLLNFGQNTLSMADHNDHVHVGFRPLFGQNTKLGAEAFAVLKPGQWADLIRRLKSLSNPVVRTSPSKFALPAKHGR